MWTDWTFRWAFIASVSLLDAVWLWARGTGVAFHTLDDRLINAGLLLAICLVTNFAVARLRYLS